MSEPAKIKRIPDAKRNPVRQGIFNGRNDTRVNVVTYDGIVVDAYQTSSASEIHQKNMPMRNRK